MLRIQLLTTTKINKGGQLASVSVTPHMQKSFVFVSLSVCIYSCVYILIVFHCAASGRVKNNALFSFKIFFVSENALLLVLVFVWHVCVCVWGRLFDLGRSSL